MRIRALAALVITLLLVGAASACADRPAPITVTLDVLSASSDTATQLDRRLPVELRFDDRMGTAQVAPLPFPLDAQGQTLRGYRAGDVAYWEAEQSIVVFLTDGASVPERGLVLVGRVGSGLKELSGCVRDCAVLVQASGTGG